MRDLGARHDYAFLAVATNVYVDGFNLYYGALKGTPYKWLDLMQLCRRLLPRDQVQRIRYFTAMVNGRGDPQRPARQEAYLRALETIPELSIHFGLFKTRPALMPLVNPFGPKKMVSVYRTEEKGSDVNLASYLLLDAFKQECDTAVVISNDSDLAEPIRMAQDELHLNVGVINPHPAKYRSQDLRGTFFKQLRQSVLGGCQFPPSLTDAIGTITKPQGW
jgi:uncharacterized LabA/DUF88 family protein